nr:MAG TPA: hypothetical protein [Caudoviricetes sp.]
MYGREFIVVKYNRRIYFKRKVYARNIRNIE